MRHKILVRVLYGEDGEEAERLFKCLTHDTDYTIDSIFLPCVKNDPDPQIEYVEEWEEEAEEVEDEVLRGRSLRG